MIKGDLEEIGKKIRELRLEQNLKQSELAYEAGVSERTLQRIEAGDVVKSDGLVQVIRQLGRLAELKAALTPPEFSPRSIATQPSKPGKKKRVRHSKKQATNNIREPAPIIWPEDQE